MHRAHPVLRIAPSLVIALALASPAFADDAPRTGGAAVEARPVVPAAVEVRRAPRTAEEQALADVREATATRVKELMASMEGQPDGPALRALQLKVVELKRDGDLQFLRTKLQFARQRGDLAAVQGLEARILTITNPPARKAAATVSRPAPGATTTEGGRP